MWTYLNFGLQVLICLAVAAFILYDSRKKRKKEPRIVGNWKGKSFWEERVLEDGHHRPGPGTLGHPEGCEHMASPEERAEWEKKLDQGTDRS